MSLLLAAAIAVVRAQDATQTRVSAPTSSAVVGVVSGRVTDEAGRALAGVTVRLTCGRVVTVVVTSDAGTYQMNAHGPSPCAVSFSAMNFASVRRPHLDVRPGTSIHLDVVLPLRVTADVVVTADRTFRNLADLDHPEESLVGIADAASEGAVTGRQIAERPVMRPGEVLESVPGVIISQHSGEGKANQYYLRGFNLDHGTDFATTVVGVPVNLPTHAHGQGYSDLNFLIPELVSGVQFRKGPYSAEDGDFSAAGAATINYVNALDAPLVDVSGGEEGWARVLAAASPRVGTGHLLAAIEIGHNDGPWVHPDDDRKVNGVVRFSTGGPQQAFSVTGMAYAARWNSTDQVPDRAIASGLISRFGAIDDTDGGRTHRVNVSADYQHGTGQTLTRTTAYVSRYALNLFSDFTYALDDPEHGDQFEQADRRWVSGARVTHRRLASWHGVSFENAVGAQYRHDAIPIVGLYHTAAQTRLSTVREDAVDEQSLGVFAESSAHWTPWLRTTAGLRVDGYRFDVSSNIPANSGLTHAGLVSPKLGIVLGPWKKT
ncbi:MAG TPA: TonB-dependent receptor, partial [Vicinamibacterales bacterium]|nr:TonB-dependent receptor [Vicinamibacterales bacterium]